MHLLVNSINPSYDLAQRLLQVNPSATQIIAIDLVPKDSLADPETWMGDWIQTQWTPLSRAKEKQLENLANLFQTHRFNNQSLIDSNPYSNSNNRGYESSKVLKPQNQPPINSPFTQHPSNEFEHLPDIHASQKSKRSILHSVSSKQESNIHQHFTNESNLKTEPSTRHRRKHRHRSSSESSKSRDHRHHHHQLEEKESLEKLNQHENNETLHISSNIGTGTSNENHLRESNNNLKIETINDNEEHETKTSLDELEETETIVKERVNENNKTIVQLVNNIEIKDTIE